MTDEKNQVALKSDDKGTLIVTFEKDGTVTVRARSPDACAESKVNLSLADFRILTQGVKP